MVEQRKRGRPPYPLGQERYDTLLHLTKEADKALDDLHTITGMSRSTQANLAIGVWEAIQKTIDGYQKKGNPRMPVILYLPLELVGLLNAFSAKTGISNDQIIEDLLREEISKAKQTIEC